MIEESVKKILERVGPLDVVVDIGGWAQCFNRANFVLDQGSYETRNFNGQRIPFGPCAEHFSAATWIVRDLCDREPYPFADKSVDFVICSQTLEDVRDPLWVCSEMNRIARCGYIEVPSRLIESCRGVEGAHVGYSHHRWLIEIERNHIRFLMKYHSIEGGWQNSFPSTLGNRFCAEDRVQYLFWEDGFSYEEISIHGSEAIQGALADYVIRAGRMSPEQLRREFLREQLRGLTQSIRGPLASFVARVLGRLV